MPSIESIFVGIEFIEAHLCEDIAVADIADATGYSLYHFCREFNRVVKHSPYDYLMRRRLAESTQELVQTDRRIIDIALDYRFNNPETYSRAFKRIFGTQPNRFRKRERIDRRRVMPPLTLAHLQHANQGTSLQPVLEERDTLHVAGIMTSVREDQTVIPELWKTLVRELEGIGAEPGRCWGVIWYPRDWQDDSFFYLAGTETESPSASNRSLVVKTMPDSMYARFTHRGPWKSRHLTLDYAYHTWLPKSGYGLGEPVEIECYEQGFGGFSDAEAEGEIYVPIKSPDLVPPQARERTEEQSSSQAA